MLKIFLAFIILFSGLQSSASWACGSNSPEQLQERAERHFKTRDVNKDSALQFEEFVADERSWAQLFEDKLPLIDVFKGADTDHSGGLSYQEWTSIRSPQLFALDGC